MGCLIAARPLFVLQIMEITEKQNMSLLIRELWEDFFPNKNTPADDIPRVVQNKDWVKDSLLFYGWTADKYGKLNVDMVYVDAGAVLYSNGTPCCLISIDMTSEPKMRFTYVDNRAQ